MFKLTTLTQLIVLVLFAITLNLWRLNALFALMAVLFFPLISQESNHFLRLLKRLKWFFLFIFTFPALNTPGEHLFVWHGIKPTYEGLEAGLTQVLRVTLMLAALSLILVNNTKQELISGLYFLLKPLSVIGLNIKRFAVRLSLTLHYVEVQENKTIKTTVNIRDRLKQAFTDDDIALIDVTLDQPSLKWLDFVVIFTVMVTLIAYLVRGI